MSQFTDFGLNPALLRAIKELGFENPMPIQEQTIPVLLEQDVDFVGLAQTGTGKTAAFGLPLLNKIDAEQRCIQALILCPTRELCMQITRDLRNYARYIPEILIVPVYGGASIELQFKDLAKKPQIIVATPGRLRDMIRRNRVDFTNVKTMILDEADEMLNMGFQEEVDDILEYMPKEGRHTMLFSATMPKEVEAILNKYMTDPVKVAVGERNSGTANVDHIYYMMAAKDRYSVLKRIIDYTPSIYGIIFCRTKLETQEIADNLIQDGYNAAALHGDLSQGMRDNVMDHFRKRSLQLLVATDVAARGIDVKELTHIINYNLPDDIETYVHRSGRTGRADKRGICLSLINLREKSKIKKIEKIVGRPFEKAMIPTGKEVCEKQLFNHIDRIEHVDINREEIDDYLPVVFRKLDWMSREELITRMVALNFNRFLDYYKDAVDLNVTEREEKKDRKERQIEREHRDETMKRLYFGMGKNDHILPQKIIGKINDVTRSKNIPIGRIDLYPDFSYVDVEESFVPLILECFADPHSNPRGIVVEVAKEQPERKKASGGEKKGSVERKERKERRERDEFREKRERRDDDFAEKKSKKKKKERDDDRPYYKSERSRDGREWLEPDWKEHLDDIEVFIDDDDRPSRKQRNAERGFGAKKGSGSASSRGSSSRGGSSRGGSSRGSSSRGSSSRESGRGRRGASRYEDDFYAPRRRGGGRRR
ncbi:MAG: DEAD/DEAH box helicase [Bacteroidales bacterium]|nr:DEAD/DEAH box helicase [Bacteroidales bacterium]MBR5631121.1 DEAD/DEAH box helicase [Bacteroidales bacterium]